MFARLIAPVALLSAPVLAGPVSVSVRGPDGLPLAGAVVTLEMPGVVPPAPSGPYRVEQRNIRFEPHVLLVPVGASVSFPNRDRMRHHVYSFSKPKRFELRLYGREESRFVTFDKPGVVALGCNIHDAMGGFLFVAATPFAAQADAGGAVRFAAVPAGAGTLRVWHPSIRAGGNSLARPVRVGPAGLVTAVAIRR